jgi:hypothetical protein
VVQHVIELFVSGHCISCPDARDAVVRFCRHRPDVTLIERPIERDRDVAAGYGLFATPAAVVDSRVVLYGVPSAERLAAACDQVPER